MHVMTFLDTNILLYAISGIESESLKAKTARELLQEDAMILSVQVLQEFYVQATRKTKADRIAHEQACLLIDSWMRFRVIPITEIILLAALDTRKRFGLSYWDSAIIEAARFAGCDTILSEDLSQTQDYDGIRVMSPFS